MLRKSGAKKKRVFRHFGVFGSARGAVSASAAIPSPAASHRPHHHRAPEPLPALVSPQFSLRALKGGEHWIAMSAQFLPMGISRLLLPLLPCLVRRVHQVSPWLPEPPLLANTAVSALCSKAWDSPGCTGAGTCTGLSRAELHHKVP